MMMPGSHDDSDHLARFRAEADAVARLQHPNIVQIFDVGEAAGRPFLAFELVEGESLAASIGGTPKPARSAAEIVLNLARAVEYAHGRGVIHRDLKPSNVLLTLDGQPKVMDFGLAKRLFVESARTGYDSVLGTPSYMAPEQARGQSRDVGPWSDVYGLGAILYELLTGRPPFKAETALETLRQVTATEVVPPNRLVSSVPRDLETICLKCLEKDPARRYERAGNLADDLRCFLAGAPIRARRIHAWERVWKWARRRPAIASLSALCLVVCVGGAAGVAWQWRQAKAAYRETAEALAIVQRHLYQYRAALAERAQLSGQARLADQILDDCPKEERGWEWQYLKGLRLGGPAPLRHESQVFAVSFRSDGSSLAVGEHNGNVTLWDARTWNRIGRFAAHQRWARGVAFSPDGTLLATAGWDGNVKVWDSVSGSLMWTGYHDEKVNAVSFSRDGRFLVSGGTGECPVQVWDVGLGCRIKELRGHRNQVLAVALSPDGSLLATGSADQSVKLWSTADWHEIGTLPDHRTQVMGIAFSPDGRRLAVACGGFYENERVGDLKIWSVDRRRVERELGGQAGGSFCVAFTADGRRLLVGGSSEPAIRIWDPDSGLQIAALRGHTDAIWGISLSPDGRKLVSASSDHTVRIWDGTPPQLRAGVEKLTLGPLAAPANAIAIDPVGDLLALGCGDGTVAIRRQSTGATLKTLDCDRVSRLVFSGDGRYLAAGSTSGNPHLWKVGSWQELTIGSFGEVVLDVAFLPANRGLALTNGNTIELLDLPEATSRQGLTLRGHADYLLTLGVHPDGRLLASAGYDGTIRIWSIETRGEILSIPAHQGRVTSLAFNPDGSRLLSAGGDGALLLWETKNWRLVWRGSEETGSLHRVVFSPDGRRFASAGASAAIKIWEVGSGRVNLELRGHTDTVRDLAFSPDGGSLVSASLDHTAKVWAVP
jgi:WD40 repeat protein